MRSLFVDISNTIRKALNRSGFTISRILSLLGIARYRYYRNIDPDPVIDWRFNPFAITEEWIVVGYKRRNPRMNHREMAHAMMDDDIAYMSPSAVYNILKKHDLVNGWKRRGRSYKETDKLGKPDEIWQVDIMYVKVLGVFYYLIIFIDVYSRCIVHHNLMPSMDGNSVSNEAQFAIEKLRKDLLRIRLRSDNKSMEKHLYRGESREGEFLIPSQFQR